MSGAELQDAIVECARSFGYRAAHFAPARTMKGWRTPARYDALGFPDLILVRPRSARADRPGRLIFAEVKGDGDRLRAEQRVWQEVLQGVTGHDSALVRVDVFTWTPVDWLNDTIVDALR